MSHLAALREALRRIHSQSVISVFLRVKVWPRWDNKIMVHPDLVER